MLRQRRTRCSLYATTTSIILRLLRGLHSYFHTLSYIYPFPTMADSLEYRFVSTFDTNHSEFSNSLGPTHIRSLLLPYHLSAQASLGPSRHPGPPAISQHASGDQIFISPFEFSLPLMPKVGYSSDPQLNAAPAQFRVPLASQSSPSQDMYTNGVPPITTSISVPVSALVNSPASTPILCGCSSGRHEEADQTSTSVTSPIPEDAQKVASSALSLQNLCHVPSSTGIDKSSVAPPVVDCPSPDLLRLQSAPAPAPSICNTSAYSACPSAEFSAPAWSPPSSIPSLSCGSLSGSEGNYLLSPSSRKLSFSDFLRLSISPTHTPVDCDLISASPPPLPLGIFADINMRECALDTTTLSLCVNPADIMSDSLRVSSPSTDWSASPEPEPSPISAQSTPSLANASAPGYSTDFPSGTLVDLEFLDEAISAIVTVLKSSIGEVEPSDNDSTENALSPDKFVHKPCEVLAPQPLYAQREQLFGDNLGMFPGLSAVPTPAPGAPGSSSDPGKRMPLAELHLPQPQYSGPSYPTQYPLTEYPQLDAYTFPAHVPAPAVEPFSPVLNAHAGISLEELRRRATDYRQRSGGAELDKTFLQCFAGRLSARGELLDDYRCYVTGCEQRNKRRDHILVHVGSHVEHRPWACRHWCAFAS